MPAGAFSAIMLYSPKAEEMGGVDSERPDEQRTLKNFGGNQTWMAIPTPDIGHGCMVLEPRTSFLNFFPVGPGAQGRLLRSHTDPDDLFRGLFQQLGIGVFDEGMPMPQTDIHSVSASPRTIQLLF